MILVKKRWGREKRIEMRVQVRNTVNTLPLIHQAVRKPLSINVTGNYGNAD